MPDKPTRAAPEKSEPVTFHTTLLRTGKNTVGIKIPEAVVQSLGSSKKPLVRVTLNHYTYRGAVAVMGGEFWVGVSAENRQPAGVEGGEEMDVTLELDLEPRNVEIPEDLETALVRAGALQAFEKSSPSSRKEFVRQVLDAKTQETRDRRIEKIVTTLRPA